MSEDPLRAGIPLFYIFLQRRSDFFQKLTDLFLFRQFTQVMFSLFIYYLYVPSSVASLRMCNLISIYDSLQQLRFLGFYVLITKSNISSLPDTFLVSLILFILWTHNNDTRVFVYFLEYSVLTTFQSHLCYLLISLWTLTHTFSWQLITSRCQ